MTLRRPQTDDAARRKHPIEGPVPSVLAVDDNGDILELIRRAAAGAGHQIEAVTTGAKFMDAFSRLKPEVVILDVFMPDMDGIELIRWLADVESTARLIIMSGDPMGPYGTFAAKLAEASGARKVAVLAKPFRMHELLTAIAG